MFKCDKCGECCRNLQMSNIYSGLDRGDGVCKYLDGDLCSIYSKRPVECRIDECYEKFFSSIMSKEEYYIKNKEVCDFLKNKARKGGK